MEFLKTYTFLMTSVFDSNGNKPSTLNFYYLGNSNFLYVEGQTYDGLWFPNNWKKQRYNFIISVCVLLLQKVDRKLQQTKTAALFILHWFSNHTSTVLNPAYKSSSKNSVCLQCVTCRNTRSSV